MTEDTLTPDLVLDRLAVWGEAQPNVRAMILTSGFAVPGERSDALSDYDIMLVLRDVRAWYDDRTWLDAFGTVLVLYHDPPQEIEGGSGRKGGRLAIQCQSP